jgi:hypothetical protein
MARKAGRCGQAAMPIKGSDSRHGGALCPVLPPAARRPDRWHRDDRQGRDDPHHRLRDAGEFRRYTGTLAGRVVGRRRRRFTGSPCGRALQVITDRTSSGGAGRAVHRDRQEAAATLRQPEDHQPVAGFLGYAGGCLCE